jgi:hypothetical protein
MDRDNFIILFGWLMGIAIGFTVGVLFFTKTEIKISSNDKPLRTEIIKTDNKIDTIYVYKLK